jgi:murein DD-endopeptidase MepM/ murein hydrolase activator NlpD
MKFASVALVSVFAASSAHLEACEIGNQLQHPAQGEIYKNFGYSQHPLLHTVRLHAGLDYKGAVGDAVVAAGTGTVTVAGREGGYGNYVRIDHGNGFQTAYAHLLNYNVKPGQCISKDEIIGSLGNSGLSSGPHLHFEVFQHNRFVDPCDLLPNHSGCQTRNTLHDCRGRDCEPGEPHKSLQE